MQLAKTSSGRFFEDFRFGDVIAHATPRTITQGDRALYNSLYGSRFAVQSSDVFAEKIGYAAAPLDDLLVFHMVFGKTVPDISINAVANLGYAQCRFLAPVYPGDTLTATSEVIGLKENSNGESGVVYVRSRGFNQHEDCVLDYVRWVMVRKADRVGATSKPHLPPLDPLVAVEALGDACPLISVTDYDPILSGSIFRFHDYELGEQIDHVDGVTIEEAEHQMATRLYQNTAKVHFDGLAQASSRFGKRLIYGGVVMSLARALSFNGLGNAFHIAAINAGRHVAPLFAGDTVYAWSEVLDKAVLPGRDDVGALRLRLVATKNRPCADFPRLEGQGYDPSVILDLDYWALTVR